MEHLIELKDVYKIYNEGESEVRALDGVSIAIDQGEFAAIIGHSGSGKSTMMNILGCLDIPSSGEYLLAGEQVSHMDDDRLSRIRGRKIGFIFQGFNLIPSLDAMENVELPLIYRGIPREERHKLARESLCRVGLGQRLDHRPSQMSGGQQQRVAIARAIAAKPPILLADEPTGNLDFAAGQEVMEILRGLHDEGHTVVLITHDSEIAASAPRAIQLFDGKVTEDRRHRLRRGKPR
ncbi:ABC transporter ATP-binding protein [Zongyangia hominis]|uniref:ABC transporter ATP-binding protein n=1 Tax=Zongyangia hominis TaxID=2763677 RepID=A0A926IC20_9FIRM|nr:ABC transporter ATP-binding protein [Zongyangia hominis]MBC8570660.1 ABC transporter ATP-binding protein [Zongyangia hominis]